VLFDLIEQIMTTATKQIEGIDAYLAGVPATHRAALNKLRGQIKKLYPKATEHISYGMPLFKLHGHPLAVSGQQATFRAVRLEAVRRWAPWATCSTDTIPRPARYALLRANLFWAHHQGDPRRTRKEIKDL